MTDERPRTVVFGLDGAHFELLEPRIEAGELPNIEQAVETGITADLESVLPPVTSPNWKAYATGKNPGKLGIFWWENIDVDNRRIYYPQNRKHQHREYWEIFSEHERPGVIGVPTTYPPKPIDEFIIAGAPDGRNEGFAYPEALEDRLIEDHDYQVTIKNELRATPDKAAEEILEVMETRFTVARELFEEYDLSFLQVTTFYINSLQHYFWDDEYTLRGWKIIDDHLGWFLDEGHDVVLMSDHGSTAVDTVFHANSWLEQQGYLTLDADAAKLVHRLGINRDRLLRLLSAFGLQALAVRFAPQFLLDLVPDEQGELPRESKTSNIDWERTDVVASGQGPIYLTVDRDADRYEQLRTDVIAQLESLTGPDGRPVATAVHRGEDVYSGEYSNEIPDIVIDQRNGVHIQGSIGRQQIFSNPDDDGWKGENKREGLFVATGPSFETGSTETLSILDLAPTLLHLRGYDVPTDMDGQVRQDVFEPNSDPAQREPSYEIVDEMAHEKRRVRRAARSAF